jgi:hypothetical protein
VSSSFGGVQSSSVKPLAMPPRPKSRLDLIIVPQHPLPEAAEAVDTIWRHGVAQGVLLEDGAPGHAAGAWIADGFAGVRVERPDRARFYHSGLGGLRVQCPQTNHAIIQPFVAAIGSWRAGGDGVFSCQECQQTHALSDLNYRPNAAFGERAIAFLDVQCARFSGVAQNLLDGLPYDFAIVLHRPG